MKNKYNIQTWAGAGVKDAEGVSRAIANRAELNPPIIENHDGDTDDSEDTSAPADSLNTDMLK